MMVNRIWMTLQSWVYVCIFFSTANIVQANDGFYQGAGSTLTLVKNSHLRVLEEVLLITPVTPPQCYPVYANGKAVKDGMDLNIEEARITLGEQTSCTAMSMESLRAKWHVVAHYRVDALQSQEDVLIGFPVDTWRREFDATYGLEYLYAPGVANFHTYINNEEIFPLELKKLKSYDRKLGVREELGYTWTASFEAGKSYYLRTEYDFGVDTSNAFYKGREYLRGETPWFSRVMPEPFSAEKIKYFLTPLSSWASPPPDRINIQIQLPSGMPVTYFVPLELKPSCVSSKSLYYQLENQFPTYDLSLSMPDTEQWNSRNLKPLRTLKQWSDWRKTLGGDSVSIGCDVVEELKKTAAPDLAARISSFHCVMSCAGDNN